MKNESENIVAQPLDTPEAQVLWGILMAYGYLGEDLKPVDPDAKKATLLADSIATLLQISPRWEPFERIWFAAAWRPTIPGRAPLASTRRCTTRCCNQWTFGSPALRRRGFV